MDVNMELEAAMHKQLSADYVRSVSLGASPEFFHSPTVGLRAERS
jgi:hypothetical protein